VQRFLIAAASVALAFAVTAVPKAALAQPAPAAPAASITMPPAPGVAPAPATSPAPAVAATPVGVRPETFVVGDYLANPAVFNAASAGKSGLSSYEAKFAAEFKVENLPFMMEFEDRGYAYTHFASSFGACPRPGCVQQINGTNEYIHQSVERDIDKDGKIGFRIAYPRIYAVVAYLGRESSFNYPVVNGVGLGFEKLPDYERQVSVYFSGLYFPDLEGKFTVLDRTTGVKTIYTLTERVLRYQAGVAISPFKNVPAFLDLGVLGDGIRASSSDPNTGSHFAGYAGIGLYSK
jgi:hypothetical protein